MQLNIDLSSQNPVQSDNQFANVPLPSAHLVSIVDAEMKKSTDQATGFDKGENLVFHCEILHSSTGNEFVGQRLPLYVARTGNEVAIQIGMRRLSTLAHTLGLGNYIANTEQLYGQPFIIVLDKDQKSNYPIWKKILRADGLEIASANGDFKEVEFKEVQLQTELHKLLQGIQGGGQPQQPQGQAITGFNNAPAQPAGQSNPQAGNFGTQGVDQSAPAQQQTQSFVPNQNFGNTQAQQSAPAGFSQPQQPQGTPNFGGQPQGNWGQTVNQSNGQ